MAKLTFPELCDALRVTGSRSQRIETKLTVMMSLLGIMPAVMPGGFYAVWAQLVAMAAKLGG
jgi:nitrogen fixation/metabolism regulation signal transduction histidine kinase